MINKDVTIYVSENCAKCTALLEQMNNWNVTYTLKNITSNRKYLEELQAQGVFGTPATFIEGQHKPVLGCQINEIRHIFGLDLRGSPGNFRQGSI